MTKKILFLATTALAMSGTSVVLAQEIQTQRGTAQPPTDIGALSREAPRDFVANPTGVSFGGMLGYGFGDQYGVGLGAKGGYTFPNRVYVGGNLNYHFGTSQDFLDNNTVSSTTWFLGPEAGYDFGVGPVILRPVVGVGMGFNTNTVQGTLANTDDTRVRPYIAPGASVHYPIGNFFVGGDGRFMIMSDANSLNLLGTAGVHL